MYPVLKEGVSIGTFQYEGSDATHYFIENADGEEFEISRRLWDALLKADGTRPLDLPDNGRRILPKLKRHGLVRTSRFVQDNGLFNRFILFPIGNRLQAGRLVFKALNAALPAVSILAFAISVYVTASEGAESGDSFSWWLYYALIVLSLALHELGHLVAGVAYGYKISDTGILLLGIIPFGAYVAHEDKKDATKAEKIQFALAGVEVNLLMAGICLILAMQSYQWSRTMFSVANVNVILAGVNLLPASGLDGESSLSAMCGVDSISEVARKWLTNKKCRKKLLRAGLPGYACFCFFSVTMISKVILWLLIGLDVVLVFFNIF